ncbi:Lrp/AsnC family transcriptional regulator [Flavisphingomonas formosensis]|uniref:Lrp/AsnC family transcriptional regulator n=1 Tax=Flavisphingomonas formosensis TaxID=861534 RepID=UPI0018E00634|nr:Lrp/AsnC family transcriptional regulator [Sphingomonas formosensis]
MERKEQNGELTRQERAILTHLQEDCRQTTAALAEKVHMSTTPCWRAVRRLEEAGIIDAYRASVQPSKLGYSVNAVVIVQVDSHRDEHALEFEEAVQREERIVECLVVSGPADYQLRVVADDIEEFSRFSRRTIARMPHVREVRTSFVLKEVKSFKGYPIPVR